MFVYPSLLPFAGEFSEFDHIAVFSDKALLIEDFAQEHEAVVSPLERQMLREPTSSAGYGDSPTQVKSFSFAVDAGKTAMMICALPKAFSIGNQLLRCSSSVGANVEEANGGSSPRDFAMKMSISLKEARESKFWIRYTLALGLINQATYDNLYPRADELIRLLARIVKTTNERYPRNKQKSHRRKPDRPRPRGNN